MDVTAKFKQAAQIAPSPNTTTAVKQFHQDLKKSGVDAQMPVNLEHPEVEGGEKPGFAQDVEELIKTARDDILGQTTPDTPSSVGIEILQKKLGHK